MTTNSLWTFYAVLTRVGVGYQCRYANALKLTSADDGQRGGTTGPQFKRAAGRIVTPVVVNVDVSVETLRTRLRQGKVYGVEKIEQALGNFFRKGNLLALRELALREVAEDQAAKAQGYREREGLEQAVPIGAE